MGSKPDISYAVKWLARRAANPTHRHLKQLLSFFSSCTSGSSLIHVTDWLPTLYSMAGGSLSDLGGIDGIDQWAALNRGGESARKEMLYNIRPEGDGVNGMGAALR